MRKSTTLLLVLLILGLILAVNCARRRRPNRRPPPIRKCPKGVLRPGPGYAQFDPRKVRVQGCKGGPMCIFNLRNKEAVMTVPFIVPGKSVTDVTARASGLVGPVALPTPTPLPQHHACNTSLSGLTCPLVPNEPVVFTGTMPLSETWPNINLNVQLELEDQDGETMVCIEFPVALKKF